MTHPLLKRSLLVIHVVIPITFGGMIYLFFRAKSLLMFRWADTIGIVPFIDRIRAYNTSMSANGSHWFLYSLPDGLWVYSLTAFMIIIWERKLSKSSLLWISLGPLLALGGEFGQALGIIIGTYDPIDLLLCAIGSLLPLIFLFPQKQKTHLNGEALS